MSSCDLLACGVDLHREWRVNNLVSYTKGHKYKQYIQRRIRFVAHMDIKLPSLNDLGCILVFNHQHQFTDFARN